MKQMKVLYYLYLIEDISVLATYEVYCETKDSIEFISTLNQIFMIYSLKNHLDVDFEEIESFDELIEQ